MHDSFPHSLEISKNGYTAFALIYRPDDPYNDLAQAITFIYDNAEQLGVKREDYSLWGGSAGARMAATLGNSHYLYQLTGRSDIPQAAAVLCNIPDIRLFHATMLLPMYVLVQMMVLHHGEQCSIDYSSWQRLAFPPSSMFTMDLVMVLD